MRMPTALAILTLLVIAAAARAQSQSDVQAAKRDREAHYPNHDDWPYIAYITPNPSVGKDAEQLRQAIKLVIASDSVQPIIERCAPTEIGNGLLRIDLRDLHWRYEDWGTVAYHRNPYADHFPLVVRADWLLVELSDLTDSDSYTRLIFGGNNLPKTRDDILKFFHVGDDAVLNFGLTEGKSGVSKQGTRRIEFRPVLGTGFATRTEDVRELTNERDSIEHPAGGGKFDAEEGIIGIVKISATSGQRGVLQWYYLADGNGKIIDRADPDIVADSTHFRNRDDIHNPGSCIQCHAEGLKKPTLNLFRALLDAKVNVYADRSNVEQLQIFNLSDVGKAIGRYQDDFQTVVQLVCGVKSRDAIAVGGQSFKEAINRYDAPLTLEQTAAELGVTVDEWTKALAINGTITARLSSLTVKIPTGGGQDEVGTIPRAAWEQDYLKAYDATHGGPPIKQEPAKAPEKPKAKPQQRRRAA